MFEPTPYEPPPELAEPPPEGPKLYRCMKALGPFICGKESENPGDLCEPMRVRS